MCGRYTLTHNAARQLDTWLDARWQGEPARPSYNIAPTQHAPICRLDRDGGRVLEMFRWGLIPSWSKDASIAARTINARGETAATRPAFRAAFRSRRCLVPASGYYEWETTPSGKQPHWIHSEAEELLTFAGLWESWLPDDASEPVHSFTILTTESNRDTRALHERMPVLIMAEDARARWLDAATGLDELQLLLVTAPQGVLQHHPVDRRVGRPEENDSGCILPLTHDNDVQTAVETERQEELF